MEPSDSQELMSKLAEAHKKEKHRLNLRIIQLQKKLEDKQRLELEIEQMSSGVEDMIPIFQGGGGDGDGDADAKNEIESLKENLMEKNIYIGELEELNEALMIEQSMKDELQHARKVLVDEISDEEDCFMKDMEKEWGTEVYNSMVTGLIEMNEYNPYGRRPVPELWNFAEGRKATLGECIEFILRLPNNRKRKESC